MGWLILQCVLAGYMISFRSHEVELLLLYTVYSDGGT